MSNGSIEAKNKLEGYVATAVGFTPTITVGSTITLSPEQQAYVELSPNSTAGKPILNFGIPQGERGERGLQGEKGEPGEKGENGQTPTKGVDYWTEEEQNQIKAYCDEYIDTQIIQAIGGEY